MPGIDDIRPYGKQADPGDPKPKGGKTSVQDLKPFYANGEVFGKNVNLRQNPDDFRFQLKTNADNEKLRAQDQGFWETMGIKAANFVPNVITGMGEMAGYAGTLGSEFGTDRDYSNKLTELMQSWKDPFGEIYRENPNQTFDLTDSAWWIDNVGSLMESATQFAIPGAGLGKVFKGLSSAAAAKVGTRAALAAGDVAAQTATAATLAYAEGAMSGYQVFQNTYDNQYRKAVAAGMDPIQADRQAKGIASDAAATTVQMNVLMNTMLNMTALTPLFRRSENEVTDFIRQYGRNADETADAFKSRILSGAESAGLFKNRKGITSYASESLQEGLEEVNTQYAEAEGRRVGEGKQKDVAGALAEFGQAISDVTNAEGALNFLLGAFGGVAQTVALDNIPIHKIAVEGKDGEGKTSTTLVSSRRLQADGTRKYFDNITKAIADDFDWKEGKMNELAAAKAKGDELEMERIRMELFDVLALNSVQMGMGENWIATFEEIAGTSNDIDVTDTSEILDDLNNQMIQTEDPDVRAQLQAQKEAVLQQEDARQSDAMSKGLAMNTDDNSYKTRAKEAIEDIKYYQKLHDDIYAKYSTPEEQSLGVADYLFGQASIVYRQKRRLERGEREVAKMEEDYNELYGNETYNSDIWKRDSHRVQGEIDMHRKIVDRIRKDAATFNTALTKADLKTIDKILEKYRMVGHFSADEASKALNKMMDGQIKTSEKIIDDKATELMNSAGFQEYQQEKPGATMQEYVKFLAAKYGAQTDLTEYKAFLNELRTRVQTNQANLNNMMSDSDNINKVMRKLKPQIEERRKDIIETHKKAEIEKELNRTAAAAHIEQNENVLTARDQELRSRLTALDTGIAQTRESIREINEKIRNLKLTEHSMWNLKWQTKMLQYQYKLRMLKSTLDDKQQEQLAIHDALRLNSAEILAQQQTGTPDVETVQEPVQTDNTVVQEETTIKTPKKTAKKEAGIGISPAARRLAEDNGIDISTLTPTGKGGKQIVKADVQKAIDAKAEVEEIETPPEPDEIDTLIKEQAEYLRILETNIPGGARQAFADFERLLIKNSDLEDNIFTALASYQRAVEQDLIWIFSDEVQETLDALRRYVRALPKVHDDQQTEDEQETAEGTVDNRTADEKWDKATAVEKLSAPTLIFPDQPETDNAPDVVVSKDKSHNEYKATSMLKVQNVTVNPVDYTDAKGNYRVAGVGLNENLNPDILNPDKLQNGTVLIAELATDYMGQGKVHGYANRTEDITFANFTDGEGNITDPMNVPIRLVDESGKLVGYLPTWSWMMESFPRTSGKERMRNIVPEILMPDGSMFNNLALQQERLRKFRQLIAEAGTVQVTVEKKGPGRVIMHVDTTGDKPRYTKALASEMLPDTSLQFAVINQGVVNISRNNPITVTNDAQELQGWHNAPVVVLPMANGQYTASPLYMDDLGEVVDQQSVERAIWLYLKSKDKDVQDELKDVFKRTGYDFANPEHLRRYIVQQFTYLQSFNATHTAHNPEADNNNFLFNITDPSTGLATVMVGFANSGKQPVIANLKNKELSPDFLEVLREGMAMRQRNVNYTKDEIVGINNVKTFNEVLFQGGKWKVNTHNSYNEFIKSHALTYVDGRNQLADRYVYAANPMITLQENTKVVLKDDQAVTATLVPVRTEEAPAPETDAEQFSSDDIDAAGELFGFQHRSSIIADAVVTSINPGLDMQPLSMKLLTDLHTFTPSNARNGKTPEQVYREMLEANIPYLADGHNPFLKCG
jgi:e3 binding domain